MLVVRCCIAKRALGGGGAFPNGRRSVFHRQPETARHAEHTCCPGDTVHREALSLWAPRVRLS